MKLKHINYYTMLAILMASISSCSDDAITDEPAPIDELPDWYYAGGELGTTFLSTSNALEQPTPAVENQGLYQSFKNGEAIFEKPFMANQTGVRSGLGPVYIRTSCLHCHPNYSHGSRIPEGSFNTTNPGNGCLLVVYDPQTEAYVSWLAGMPQGHAVAPFKAPIDESKITVIWKNATDDWGNRFEDGETYELSYPEVNMPKDAIYVVSQGYELPTCSRSLKSVPRYSFKSVPPRGITVGRFSILNGESNRHKNVNRDRNTNNRTFVQKRRLQPPRDSPEVGYIPHNSEQGVDPI